MGATHQALLMHGGAGGGGGGWTPLDLFPGSVRGAWWDPSDLSTLWQDLARTIPVTTTGQSVAIMDDKSGNGMELVQGVSGARPILQNDGTNYYLDFDGTDDFLSYNTGSNLRIEDDDINVVFGMKTDTTAGYTTPFARSLQNSEAGRYWMSINSDTFAANYQYNGSTVALATKSFTSTANHVMTMTVDRSANNSITLREDAAATTGTYAAESTNHTPNRRFLLGAYNDPTDAGQVGYFNGRIYGMILWFAPVDADDIDDAEAWMADKTGVTL
jgi:hypothetical protein